MILGKNMSFASLCKSLHIYTLIFYYVETKCVLVGHSKIKNQMAPYSKGCHKYIRISSNRIGAHINIQPSLIYNVVYIHPVLGHLNSQVVSFQQPPSLMHSFIYPQIVIIVIIRTACIRAKTSCSTALSLSL